MMYSLFRKIPILSTIVKIVNAYVFDGDARAMDKFAPVKLWLRAIGMPFSVSLIITAVLLNNFYQFTNFSKYEFSTNGDLHLALTAITPEVSKIVSPFHTPGLLVSSVFPNLLGFGIGVYALIFALGPKSLQFFHQHISQQVLTSRRGHGSVLMLNASMAYPLIIIALSLIPAIFQQMYPDNQFLIFFTWTVFWYGIVVLIELIGVLFGLGEQDAIDKVAP